MTYFYSLKPSVVWFVGEIDNHDFVKVKPSILYNKHELFFHTTVKNLNIWCLLRIVVQYVRYKYKRLSVILGGIDYIDQSKPGFCIIVDICVMHKFQHLVMQINIYVKFNLEWRSL